MRVITIAARNYLPRIAVLAESYARHHPGQRLLVLLADAQPGEVPDTATYEVRTGADLPLESDELRRMAMIYNVTEFCTSVKPWALRMALDEGAGEVVYLDPDIEVFHDLDWIAGLAAEHGIVLTPHNVVPLPDDGRNPSTAEILQAGIYNLGFIAVGDAARPMLAWWEERLRRDCVVDFANGLFVDQKWIDRVPSLFDHVVVDDEGCNVAYWNLESRLLGGDEESGLTVNGVPLQFFHYSGYDPAQPDVLDKYSPNPRVSLADRPDVRALCHAYAAKVRAQGSVDAPYAFRSLGGRDIAPETRRRYRAELIRAEREGSPLPPLPFAGRDDEVLRWLDGLPEEAAPAPAGPQARLKALAVRSLWRLSPLARRVASLLLGLARTPHLWVDAAVLAAERRSGVSHYTAGIVRGLDELAGEGRLRYSLISAPGRESVIAAQGFAHAERIAVDPSAGGTRDRYVDTGFPYPTDRWFRPGRFLFPNFVAWPLWLSPSTVVVYDLAYLDIPECVAKRNRDLLHRGVAASLRDGARVVTISEFSARRIHEAYGVSRDRITVAPPAVDRSVFRPRDEDEVRAVRERWGIAGESYLLSVGNLEPRKNLETLVSAYASLPVEVASRHPLVLVGADGWDDGPLRAAIDRARAQGRPIIVLRGVVPDEDLPALYSGAAAFAFPSRYEGFGMPVLEALACGAPVIVADNSALPEAGGPTAAYVGTSDVEGWARALAEAVSRPRPDAAVSGLAPEVEAHLAGFSWRRSAALVASAVAGSDIR